VEWGINRKIYPFLFWVIKIVDANSLTLIGKFILFPLLGDKGCRQKLSPINRKIYPFSPFGW
jgi:hypothetical protein